MDRVGTTGGRPTCILVFSDALHVDGDLNMERTPLAGRIDEYVRKEMNRRGWSSEQFRNAGMVVVRPPARGVDKRPNDLITLRNFWGSLMAAAGGRLLSMATDIPKQVWSKEEK
mgnify:CR=1 FL=1